MWPRISQNAAMRSNITVHVSPADRKRLEALVAGRNTPAKLVWRAEIILATADGLGTHAIMRRAGKSKPCVWRWQERFAAEGVDVLTGGASAVYGADAVAGVINFVGGWVGERCWHSNTINGGSFGRAARFNGPMLWIYGDRDPFYSLRHSRAHHQAFLAAGGQAELLELDPVPGQNGHTLHPYPTLWQDALDRYLGTVAP